MAKKTSTRTASSPAAENIADEPAGKVTAPTPAYILSAVLGLGSTAATETVAALDADTQAAIQRIYTSDTSDKAVQIRAAIL